MGATRQNGVDAAIALLRLLARRNGQLKIADALTELDIARASLHRIVTTLEKSGLVSTRRGLIATGPIGARLVSAHALAVTREDELWTQRAPRRLKRAPGPAQAKGPQDVPVALSAPPRIRTRGRFRIGFSNASMDNPWRVALVHSIEHAAAALGSRVERFEIRNAGHDSARQAEDIAELVKSGVDGLLVSTVEPVGVSDAVGAATASGIPVVLVDRGVLPGVQHTSFVTTDDAMIGRTTALWMAETLKGQGNVLLLPGHADAEPARRRLAAARDLFATFPGITPLAIAWTDWHRDKARDIVRDAIATWGGDIDGVWCDSGQQGVGSQQAFIAAGRRPGEVPPHTGGDQNLAYKLAIRHKVRLAAIDYPPVMGIKAVEVLYAALRGTWVPRIVDMPSEVIITRGHGTRSVRANLLAEDHVRWDLPDDLILSTGLGPAYNPRSFRIHYPGNLYNRSAAKPLRQRATR